MPGCHRESDNRKCGAITKVIGQSSVFVNDKLWAVDGDPDDGTHGGGAFCKPIYGALNVFVENKLVICALGDTTYNPDGYQHPPGESDPKGHSFDTIVYGGAGGGQT